MILILVTLALATVDAALIRAWLRTFPRHD
jgi:hypothetical protein